MMKPALEEHFLVTGFEEYWAPTAVNVDRPGRDRIFPRRVDFGGLRLELCRGGE